MPARTRAIMAGSKQDLEQCEIINKRLVGNLPAFVGNVKCL
jgi:hypothetical protein